MILPGHISVAYLASKALGVSTQGSLAASMFPDMVDKPIRWLLRLTPNDRIPAHTGLAWGISSAVAYRLGGSTFGRGWTVGYGSHLLCDEVNAHLNPGRIYFWWPFKRYHMHSGPIGLQSSLHDFTGPSLLIELLVTCCGLALWCARHKRRERQEE